MEQLNQSKISRKELSQQKNKESVWAILLELVVGILCICIAEIVTRWSLQALDGRPVAEPLGNIVKWVEFSIANITIIFVYDDKIENDPNLPKTKTESKTRWIISAIAMLGCVAICLKSVYISKLFFWEVCIGLILFATFIMFLTDMSVKRPAKVIYDQETVNEKYENSKRQKANYQGKLIYAATILGIVLIALIIKDVIPNVEKHLIIKVEKVKLEVVIDFIIVILILITSSKAFKKIEDYKEIFILSSLIAIYMIVYIIITKPEIEIWEGMLFLTAFIWTIKSILKMLEKKRGKKEEFQMNESN